MKCNRFSTWFQSTNYTAQEEENEDSEMQMKSIRSMDWLTAGAELGSPPQDSWAISTGYQKKENPHHSATKCTVFSSFHTSKNYIDKQEPNQKTNKTV